MLSRQAAVRQRIVAKPEQRRIEIENYATEAVMLDDVRETR